MKITANLATYAPRLHKMEKMIDSIFDQVDIIRIYFNQCSPPDWIRKYPEEKILAIIGEKKEDNLTDNGKFYYLDKIQEDEYWFSMDDDLIYPKNYVEKSIENIEKFGLIITYHGRILKGKDLDYYRGHEVYPCLNRVLGNKRIDVGGTGVMAFRTDYFHPKGLAHHPEKRMSDLVFSLEVAKNKKRIGVMGHEAGWIKHIENRETIYGTEVDSGQERQIRFANEIYDLNYGE